MRKRKKETQKQRWWGREVRCIANMLIAVAATCTVSVAPRRFPFLFFSLACYSSLRCCSSPRRTVACKRRLYCFLFVDCWNSRFHLFDAGARDVERSNERGAPFHNPFLRTRSIDRSLPSFFPREKGRPRKLIKKLSLAPFVSIYGPPSPRIVLPNERNLSRRNLSIATKTMKLAFVLVLVASAFSASSVAVASADDDNVAGGGSGPDVNVLVGASSSAGEGGTVGAVGFDRRLGRLGLGLQLQSEQVPTAAAAAKTTSKSSKSKSVVVLDDGNNSKKKRVLKGGRGGNGGASDNDTNTTATEDDNSSSNNNGNNGSGNGDTPNGRPFQYLQGLIDDAFVQIAELENATVALRDDLDLLEQRLVENEDAVVDLHQQLDGVESVLERHAVEIGTLADELAAFDVALNATKEELESRIDAVEAEFESDIVGLRAAVAGLRRSAAATRLALNQAAANLQNQIYSNDAELRGLQRQIQRLQSQILSSSDVESIIANSYAVQRLQSAINSIVQTQLQLLARVALLERRLSEALRRIEALETSVPPSPCSTEGAFARTSTDPRVLAGIVSSNLASPYVWRYDASNYISDGGSDMYVKQKVEKSNFFRDFLYLSWTFDGE